jgi:hypothetical protein
MSDQIFHKHIIPLPRTDAADILLAYQLTFDFYQEVRHREAFEHYCQWYYRVAEQNRQEDVAMKNDLNLFGFFC